MKWIGAHVSISGGVENAPLNASAIGAKAFALFTKNQRQWSAPAYAEERIAAFRKNCAEKGFSPDQILAHDSYLINLGQPDAGKRKSAVAAFTDELERCHQLGIRLLNFHPGSSLKQVSDEEACALIAEGVRSALDAVPEVVAVFENTAGQGSNLGWNFDQLALMLKLTDRPERCGVCIDSCHALAAGFDLASEAGYRKFWQEFDGKVGRDFLRGMHLNDAKAGCGSHLDRHESIGKGTLGLEFFTRVVQDPRTDNIPLILETPDESLWETEIALLQKISAE